MKDLGTRDLLMERIAAEFVPMALTNHQKGRRVKMFIALKEQHVTIFCRR